MKIIKIYNIRASMIFDQHEGHGRPKEIAYGRRQGMNPGAGTKTGEEKNRM